jgi:valyl-tRNA synthetase
LSDPDNSDVRYYYPTQTLVTAPEIIFFWVARMIMAGFEYMKEKPFSDVYFTGIVRDELGRKMSKQLGNSPDLLALIDKYGADAVRFGIMISSPAGNDLLFDVKEESTLKQGSFFINKMWNALKLVKTWESRRGEAGRDQESNLNFATQWFENRLNEARTEIEEQYKDFRLSETLKTIYSLIWDDFCSWYLEWIKPAPDQSIDERVYEKTIDFFDRLLQLLHPFMPFITEDIYHLLKERQDDITITQPVPIGHIDKSALSAGSLLKEVITAIRDTRNRNQLRPRDGIKLHILAAETAVYKNIEKILSKQINADSILFTQSPVPNSITLVVQKDKFFIETISPLDTSFQKDQLQKDLDYLKGFLQSVEKKLGNERFVQNAKPEVIEVEKRKKADAEAKIKAIEESLQNL